MAGLFIPVAISQQIYLLAAIVIACLTYAIYSRFRLQARQAELAEYRRLLSADAKCIFWEAEVKGKPGWRRPAVAAPVGPFDWRLRTLDRESAELILGKGYDNSRFGDLWSAAFNPDDLMESNRRFHQAVLDGTPRLVQAFRLRDCDGQIHWYLEDVRIVPTADSEWRCTGVCIDITDRKEAEDAVRESEQRLRRLMLNARSLIFEVEAEAPPEYLENPRPELVRWKYQPLDSEIVQNLLPIEPPSEGQYFLYHLSGRRHPEDTKRLDRTFQEAVAHSAASYSQEYRCRNKHGSFQWFSETVYLTYLSERHWRLTGVVQDITARKRAEESLQDIMRQADCVVFYGTFRTGAEITDISEHQWSMSVADLDAAQRVLPLKVPEGRTYVEEWIAARDRDDMLATTRSQVEALANNVLQMSYSFRVRDMHGNTHWMSEDVRMEQIAARTYRVVTVCVDITPQKQVEEAMAQAKRAAEEANNAKTAFLANMSHEIRTPMTAVVGYSDLLTESVSAAERESYAKTIQRNCEHLMTVLDDILDLSRIESGKMTIQTLPCSPVEVAEEVSDMLRPKALAKGLELSIEVDQRVPNQIVTDPVRLRQILVNLVGNAVKFTDHGSILMRLDAGKSDKGEPMLLIDVIDTGIGIAADQIPLLFRPFQQGDSSTRRRFGGTGLGLAISRRLAQFLGGDISVVSQAGQGSTFSARVLAKPVQAPTRAHTEAAGPTRLDGIRVLIAEDGADTRRLVCIHLRRLGCSCAAVENGQIATEMALEAERSENPFDVVLMDMQMPVMDGYGACAVLRSSGYTRPIIALTAHAMEGDRERCVQAGCNDYVVKPINVTQLSRSIAKHARKSNSLAPVPQ